MINENDNQNKHNNPYFLIILSSLIVSSIIIIHRHCPIDIPYLAYNNDAGAIHMTVFSLATVLAGFLYSTLILFVSSCEKKSIKVLRNANFFDTILKLMKLNILLFMIVSALTLFNNYVICIISNLLTTVELIIFSVALIIFWDLIIASFEIISDLGKDDNKPRKDYFNE